MSSFAGSLEIKKLQDAARAERGQKWPYSWWDAPPGSIHFSPFGSLTIAQNMSNSVLVSYTIPEGFTGVLEGVLVDTNPTINGSGAVAWIPGDLNWSIGLNFTTITGGPGLPAFRFFQDFVSVRFTVGSFGNSGSPWPIWSGESDLLPSKTVISILVTTSAVIPTTGVFRGALTGYRFPNASQT